MKPKKSVPGGSCDSYYGKEQCKTDWKEYDDILRKLVKHYYLQEDRAYEC